MADYNIPTTLQYTAEDEWIREDADRVTVGVTDFAQDQLALGDATQRRQDHLVHCQIGLTGTLGLGRVVHRPADRCRRRRRTTAFCFVHLSRITCSSAFEQYSTPSCLCYLPEAASSSIAVVRDFGRSRG